MPFMSKSKIKSEYGDRGEPVFAKATTRQAF
jgi:hypothetical protein